MYKSNDIHMASASRIGQIFTLRLSERLYTSAVLLPQAANTRNKQDLLLFSFLFDLHPRFMDKISHSTKPFPFLGIGEVFSESQTLRPRWHISKDHAHQSELVNITLIIGTILPSS